MEFSFIHKNHLSNYLEVLCAANTEESAFCAVKHLVHFLIAKLPVDVDLSVPIVKELADKLLEFGPESTYHFQNKILFCVKKVLPIIRRSDLSLDGGDLFRYLVRTLEDDLSRSFYDDAKDPRKDRNEFYNLSIACISKLSQFIPEGVIDDFITHARSSTIQRTKLFYDRLLVLACKGDYVGKLFENKMIPLMYPSSFISGFSGSKVETDLMWFLSLVRLIESKDDSLSEYKELVKSNLKFLVEVVSACLMVSNSADNNRSNGKRLGGREVPIEIRRCCFKNLKSVMVSVGRFFARMDDEHGNFMEIFITISKSCNNISNLKCLLENYIIYSLVLKKKRGVDVDERFVKLSKCLMNLVRVGGDRPNTRQALFFPSFAVASETFLISEEVSRGLAALEDPRKASAHYIVFQFLISLVFKHSLDEYLFKAMNLSIDALEVSDPIRTLFSLNFIISVFSSRKCDFHVHEEFARNFFERAFLVVENSRRPPVKDKAKKIQLQKDRKSKASETCDTEETKSIESSMRGVEAEVVLQTLLGSAAILITENLEFSDLKFFEKLIISWLKDKFFPENSKWVKRFICSVVSGGINGDGIISLAMGKFHCLDDLSDDEVTWWSAILRGALQGSTNHASGSIQNLEFFCLKMLENSRKVIWTEGGKIICSFFQGIFVYRPRKFSVASEPGNCQCRTASVQQIGETEELARKFLDFVVSGKFSIEKKAKLTRQILKGFRNIDIFLEGRASDIFDEDNADKFPVDSTHQGIITVPSFTCLSGTDFARLASGIVLSLGEKLSPKFSSCSELDAWGELVDEFICRGRANFSGNFLTSGFVAVDGISKFSVINVEKKINRFSGKFHEKCKFSYFLKMDKTMEYIRDRNTHGFKFTGERKSILELLYSLTISCPFVELDERFSEILDACIARHAKCTRNFLSLVSNNLEIFSFEDEDRVRVRNSINLIIRSNRLQNQLWNPKLFRLSFQISIGILSVMGNEKKFSFTSEEQKMFMNFFVLWFDKRNLRKVPVFSPLEVNQLFARLMEIPGMFPDDLKFRLYYSLVFFEFFQWTKQENLMPEGVQWFLSEISNCKLTPLTAVSIHALSFFLRNFHTSFSNTKSMTAKDLVISIMRVHRGSAMGGEKVLDSFGNLLFAVTGSNARREWPNTWPTCSSSWGSGFDLRRYIFWENYLPKRNFQEILDCLEYLVEQPQSDIDAFISFFEIFSVCLRNLQTSETNGQGNIQLIELWLKELKRSPETLIGTIFQSLRLAICGGPKPLIISRTDQSDEKNLEICNLIFGNLLKVLSVDESSLEISKKLFLVSLLLESLEIQDYLSLDKTSEIFEICIELAANPVKQTREGAVMVLTSILAFHNFKGTDFSEETLSSIRNFKLEDDSVGKKLGNLELCMEIASHRFVETPMKEKFLANSWDFIFESLLHEKEEIRKSAFQTLQAFSSEKVGELVERKLLENCYSNLNFMQKEKFINFLGEYFWNNYTTEKFAGNFEKVVLNVFWKFLSDPTESVRSIALRNLKSLFLLDAEISEKFFVKSDKILKTKKIEETDFISAVLGLCAISSSVMYPPTRLPKWIAKCLCLLAKCKSRKLLIFSNNEISKIIETHIQEFLKVQQEDPSIWEETKITLFSSDELEIVDEIKGHHNYFS